MAIDGAVSKTSKARKTAVPPEVAASLRYAISQRLRKRIEGCFGWSKTVGGITQLKVRGLAKVRAVFVFAIAAYNIVRLPTFLAPERRSVSGGLKKERTMNQDRGCLPPMNHIQAKNFAPNLLFAKRSDFFSSLLARDRATAPLLPGMPVAAASLCLLQGRVGVRSDLDPERAPTRKEAGRIYVSDNMLARCGEW